MEIAKIMEFDGISIKRMKELSQAEKDGRLVVLPDAKYTDADGEKALQKAMWTCGNTNNPVTRYTANAIAEKLCREARDENPPLTLDELREMDGEPVWVVELNDYPPRWGLVNWYRKNKRNIVYVTINNGASVCAETFIAAGGKIYRRKPEEGTP